MALSFIELHKPFRHVKALIHEGEVGLVWGQMAKTQENSLNIKLQLRILSSIYTAFSADQLGHEVLT